MEASKITQIVKDKEPSFTPRWDRMDKDFKMWNMEDIYGEDVKSKTKAHAENIDIISNEPRRFVDDVISVLASADRQISVHMAETVTGEDREEQGNLERLLVFAFDKADERLRKLVLPPFREASLWYSAMRGWPAARILVYKSGKNVVFDFIPLDPRHLEYEVGGDGFLWVAYKTFKSKALLESDYGFEAPKKEGNEVLDWWKFEEEGKVTNAVVCNNVFLKPEELIKIPSMPFVIAPVPTRPPIAGDNDAGYGESLLASIRGVNAIRNRFASMVASHANIMANQVLINYRAEGGAELKSTTNVPGDVIELPMALNRLEASPMKEISPTVVAMLSWLSDQVERGVLPRIPIDKPPPSGTLYNLAQEAGNKIFNPQLRNLSYFYQDVCRLIEEQLIAKGIKVKVQTEKERKYFEVEVKPVDLKKPHVIKVEFTAQTPWRQLDTSAVADMLKRSGVPEGFIWEHIYKFSDPKGMQELAAIELFKKSPIGAMQEAVVALKKRGEEDDDWAAEYLVRLMDRMEAMEAAQASPMGEAPGAPPLTPGEPAVPPTPEPTLEI